MHFIIVLVLVLVLVNQKFVENKGRGHATIKSSFCNRVWDFTKITLA